MANGAIELGKRYFCREQTSGNGHYGFFYVDDDGINARLFSMDKSFHVATDDALILRLEDNRYASLHDNISLPTGSAFDNREPKLATYAQSVISNIAVLGRTAWQTNDSIRRVQFAVEHTEDLLHHTDKFDAVADAELGGLPDTKIFGITVGGVTVSAWYAPSGNMMFKRAQKMGVLYAIELNDPTVLASYLTNVHCILRFASAALGYRLVPTDIRISPLVHDDVVKAMEERLYQGDHAVHYIWPNTHPDSGDLWVGNSFAHVRTDDDLTAFVDCLRVWLERDREWRNATNLMMSAFLLRRVMSAERLLTACKWLEEIPGAGSTVAVCDEDIEKIASAAAGEAENLGHTQYKERIAGVIRGIKSETSAVRFARLIASVRHRFGDGAIDDKIVGHLRAAIAFRGKVAHGHFDPEDDEEYKAFAKSVYAMEALCYLLTIKDLPMTDDGAKRALGRSVVSNYRHFSD